MASRRKPVFFSGGRKRVADARISLSLLSTTLRQKRALGISFSDIIRFFKSQIVMAEGLRNNKYVSFEGKLYMDSFSPPWPGPAFEKMIAVYAGNVGKSEGERKDFIAYLVFAITRRCVFRCQHCYAIHTLGGRDSLPLEKILETVEEVLRIGVGLFSLEGGEPLLRFHDLLTILKAIKGRASTSMATTGFGITREKAFALKEAGLEAAHVSLDHYEPDKHNTFRRSPKAFRAACDAIRLFREAGIFPVLAVCPSPELVETGGLFRYLHLARDLGVGLIEVLDPMPSGNYLHPEEGQLLSPAQLDKLIRFHAEVNQDPRFKDHPAVSVRAYIEEGCRYGCGLGGNQHFYIDAMGNVCPCVYLNVSHGNIMEEEFSAIFRRMREAFPRPVDGLCPVYELAPLIEVRRKAGVSLPLPPEEILPLARAITGRGLPGIFKRVEEMIQPCQRK